ncbi:MAG: ABC transporter permease [Deltaproteobacteria bacterium]|jgi:NitT/TauT family transport system permease protein|nr:ABC transporter permease [Deltaproteobacteria bacterium]
MSTFKQESIFTNYFYKFGSLVLFIIVWQLACSIKLAPETFVASPLVIVKTFLKWAGNGFLVKHSLISLTRAFYGFILAVAVGVPLGFMLGGWFKNFESLISPLLRFLGQFNPFALFSVFMLLFGLGEFSKVAMIFWVSLWPILYNASLGVKSVEPLHIKLARSMGLTRISILWRIVIPSSAAFLFSGLRQASATAFFMLIPAEMLGASRGLGWMIINAQINYQIPQLYTGTALIVGFGLLIDTLFKFLEAKVVTWRQDTGL